MHVEEVDAKFPSISTSILHNDLLKSLSHRTMSEFGGNAILARSSLLNMWPSFYGPFTF